MDCSHYPILADILYFPDNDYPAKAGRCRKLLEKHYPSLVDEFGKFEDFVQHTPPRRLEQIFMRTFDVQALCCMDVGYVLFGEDYTRGKILANLNKEQHQAGIDCRGELADRLPNILRLLPRLGDQEKREEMVRYLLKPALDKMIAEFEPARVDKKEETYKKFHHTVLDKQMSGITQFRIPLSVVREVLEIDFPNINKIDVGSERDFMDAVKSEFKNQQKSNKF